jgi:hypothetical protein
MTLPAASPPPVAFPHQPADHALLQRVMDEEGVARAVSEPDWSGYLVDLARAALEVMPDVMAPARDAIARLGFSMESASIVLLAVLAAVIAALATIAVLRLVRRRRPAALPRDAVVETLVEAPRDPAVWRTLLEEHLRAGGMAEALEALWWWLAASVSRGPVDPSWTSRELLARAGRPDLGPWAARLDRMTYGPRRPVADDVRGLVDALEAAV